MKRVILGSNSPRRRELLKGLGIDFTVDTGNQFEENFGPDIPYMVILPGSPAGASGTTGRRGEILGKPKDREDAIRMLRDLSGREHHVITAVTVRDSHRRKTITDTTEVWFKPLSEEEISYYVDTYKPFDKAGAYAIQEWIGYIGISRIDGSYFNVVGFPVHRVYALLREFGVVF